MQCLVRGMPGPGHGEPWPCATARARATLSSAGPTVLPSTITIITVAMLNGMDNDFVTLDAQITSRTTTRHSGKSALGFAIDAAALTAAHPACRSRPRRTGARRRAVGSIVPRPR